jgi:hypothetical protein
VSSAKSFANCWTDRFIPTGSSKLGAPFSRQIDRALYANSIWHSNLGTVLCELGDLAGARTQLERALEITEATLGPNHPTMAALCDNLDHILQQLGGE